MRHYNANADRLNRSEPVAARSPAGRSWTSGGCRVSVMTREDAGVDCDSPWIASCDTHGEMIGCENKRAAESAARHRDWCGGCSTGTRRPTLCARSDCPNVVPEGWDGGYCVACCREIQEAQDRDRAEAEAADALLTTSEVADLADPYAEYGFDHPWEL